MTVKIGVREGRMLYAPTVRQLPRGPEIVARFKKITEAGPLPPR